MWGVAILTMLGGSIVAITQTDVKRLLAYSSIAQAGYILTGVVAASAAGLSSSLFYLAAYGITVIGAFAVVTLVRDQAGEAGHLSSWAGLGKRSPLVAGVLRLLPDRVRRHPADQRFHREVRGVPGGDQPAARLPLVIIGVLSSAILAFPYVRVIVLMFFSEPAPDGPSVVRPSALHLRRGSHRGPGHAGARHGARPAAEPGPPCGRPAVRALTAGCLPDAPGA